jgi:hypothetical protein
LILDIRQRYVRILDRIMQNSRYDRVGFHPSFKQHPSDCQRVKKIWLTPDLADLTGVSLDGKLGCLLDKTVTMSVRIIGAFAHRSTTFGSPMTI